MRDSEEFKDKSMGMYNEKQERHVRNTGSKKVMKKRIRKEKLLGKTTDNLDVAVIPIAGISLLQSNAVSRAGSRKGTARVPPSFGRKSNNDTAYNNDGGDDNDFL